LFAVLKQELLLSSLGQSYVCSALTLFLIEKLMKLVSTSTW
jgi:hypothetical protein